MSMHKFILPHAAKRLEESEPLTRLVSELHTVYGVYPYRTQSDMMSLIYPNGMLFGMAFVDTARDKDNNELVCYNVAHMKINKEKGRGELSRSTRRSRSLKMLMAQLKKEVPAFKPKTNEGYGNIPHLYERTKNLVKGKLAKGLDRNVYLSLDLCHYENIIRHAIDGVMLSEEVMEKCKVGKAQLLEREAKQNELKERLTYFDNAYVLYISQASPAVFAEVRKTEISTAAGYTTMYVPVGDWRIVNDVSDLPDDVASLMKMWRVGAETELAQYPTMHDETDLADPSPISKLIPINDKFYQDHDVVIRYDTHKLVRRDAFILIAKGPSNEKSTGC